MVSISVKISLILVIASFTKSNGFSLSTISPLSTNPTLSTTLLEAKKKKGTSSGKGFGKASETKTPPPKNVITEDPTDEQPAGGLSSIEIPTSDSFARPKLDLDPNLSEDERNKEILKQQFGLRSFEDRQGDIKAAEKRAEQRSRMKQIKQMKDEEFDILMIIPPPILRAIDFFLKTGLAITTVLFILAGFGITAEAWSVATNNQLPDGADEFIVNVIEPNFTPGLFVLLGFSVSLGVFATAQLGSGSSTYKEQ